MAEMHMGANEMRFAQMIWENEPMSSSELSRMAEEELGWKKTTSFTVLRRLCDKGLFENRKGTVKSLISREEWDTAQSEKFITESFDGSLPAFLAAFTRGRRLTEREAAELKRMVAEFEEGE